MRNHLLFSIPLVLAGLGNAFTAPENTLKLRQSSPPNGACTVVPEARGKLILGYDKDQKPYIHDSNPTFVLVTVGEGNYNLCESEQPLTLSFEDLGPIYGSDCNQVYTLNRRRKDLPWPLPRARWQFTCPASGEPLAQAHVIDNDGARLECTLYHGKAGFDYHGLNCGKDKARVTSCVQNMMRLDGQEDGHLEESSLHFEFPAGN